MLFWDIVEQVSDSWSDLNPIFVMCLRCVMAGKFYLDITTCQALG